MYSKGQTLIVLKGPCILTKRVVFAQLLVTPEPGYRQSHFPEKASQSQTIGLYIIRKSCSQKAKQDHKMPNYTLPFRYNLGQYNLSVL